MTAPGRWDTRRVDASMSLLTDMATNPVDPAYAEAASRRAASGNARPSRIMTAVVGLVAVVLGAATVWAGRELRAPEPAVLQARALLEAEIEQRTADVQALQEENADLSAEIDALSAELSGGDADVLTGYLTTGAVAGTVAVSGPGLVVTLTDSARAASGAEDAADERVQDIDLQIVTNGLWASGAEAIAINGQRLTALSAIRSAGEAVLVDLTPLVSPYRVEAVGDPDTLETNFARTAASGHLTLLRETYAIGTQVASSEDLLLPASPVPTLRYATPTGPDALATTGADVSGSDRTPGESS